MNNVFTPPRIQQWQKLFFSILLSLFMCASISAQESKEKGHEGSDKATHQSHEPSKGGHGGSEEEELPLFEIPITYVYERSDREPTKVNINGVVIAPAIRVAPRIAVVGSFSYRRGPTVEIIENEFVFETERRARRVFGSKAALLADSSDPLRAELSAVEFGAGVDITLYESHRAKLALEFEAGTEQERLKFKDRLRGTETEISPYLFIGGALDILTSNKHVSFRLIKAGFKPTFFGKDTQKNFQVETGIVFNLGHFHKH